MKPQFTPSPDLYPFESRWLQSSVGEVHYIDEGVGRPIVFCHGQPMWSFLYRHIVAGLRDQFRCVAIDYPGFGLSVRPDGYGYTPREHAGIVGELVDHLGLDDMIVMGQDWGGPIAMSMAADRPERVSGIVLGNTWFWRDKRPFPSFFSKLMSSEFMQRQLREKNFFVERLVPFSAATDLSSEVMDHYRAVQPTPELRRGVTEFPKQILASGDWLESLEARVRANLASKPTLLVWGMRDMAFRPSYLKRMEKAFSDVVVVELAEAKHYIQEDAPEEIVSAIKKRFGTEGPDS